EAITKLGSQAFKVQAEVANETEAKAMVKQAIDAFGRLDILVNNAGITKDNLIMRMKEEDFDHVIETNLKVAFICTKAVTRPMMKQKYGKSINVASIVGIAGNPGQANYVAAKAG